MTDFKKAPRILTSTPASNAKEVSLGTTEFTVEFDLDLDKSQIDNNISLETAAGVKLPAQIKYDNRKVTLTLNPAMTLEPGTEYRLHVKGDNDLDDGFTVGVRSIFGVAMHTTRFIHFTTEASAALPAPKALHPPHLSSRKERPHFEWTITDAARYEVEVAKENAFREIYWGNQYATPPVTPNVAATFPDGTYYWRVRSIDTKGRAGEWSDTFVFVMDSLELGPVAPNDTLPPELGYDAYAPEGDIEFLDTFPKEEASNVRRELKTVSFRVLGEVKAEEVQAELYGESLFGDEADHGELDVAVSVEEGPGFTTIHLTIPAIP